ncbi:aldo-keto reductase family 1 member D1 isoform X3 [Apteryx mantelli]|uniref:Aldo-keto reductase family 1 member D1 isoform X3 n=1 Tax=Apteryx mantelli TaxID=2696672 RepID=A0ABM4FGT9_9AVES
MSLTAERHRIPLSDGNSIPLLGLGTYADPQKTPKGSCLESVKIAIDTGYRHIDGAFVYYNEHEVGQAIREKIAEGRIKREDIFYCGKPGDAIYPTDENGKMIYHETDLCATWEAMEACKDAGLAKSIGVSNFNRRQLEMILNKPGLKHKPVSNQVECHPYFTQPKLLEFCRQHDIVIVGYSPLGTSRDETWVNVSSPPLLKDPVLNAIGKKYNKTSAQVALRFNIQRGVVVIPKSFNPQRIRENFQIFDFSLTEKEMKEIEALNKNVRYVELLMEEKRSARQRTVASVTQPLSPENLTCSI